MTTPAKTDYRRTLAEIRATATKAGRSKLGLCSLEGTRLFERALRAGVVIERALTTAAFRADPAPRARALFEECEARSCQIQLVPGNVMKELTGGRDIGAVVGLARLPEPTSLEAALNDADTRSPFFLGVSKVDDPGNLGALVRTAHASGAAGLLAAGACDAFHPKAVRTSMGSVFRLPIWTYRDSETLLVQLRARGVRTIGSVSEDGIALDAFEFQPGPIAMFLGSEAFGLRDEERAGFDALVTIPMAAGVDSFSVNAAAAVLMYELARFSRA